MQTGLVVTDGARRGLYGRLSSLADEVLADGAENFFFMHKPPGLRVRFEAPAEAFDDVRARVELAVETWRAEGVVQSQTPAVYEPEAHLFGGPGSMPHVHRLFTADSLMWSAFHDAEARGLRPGPAWAFSLTALRVMLDALEIVGWEDRDVWDRVRRCTGRRLSGVDRDEVTFAATAGALRTVWHDGAALRALLSPAAQALVDRFAASARPTCARWTAEYFATRAAYVGPRAALAYWTVFHWNRGALTSVRQSLITECLAEEAA